MDANAFDFPHEPDEESTKRAAQARETEAARIRQAFRDTFQSVQGQVVMEYLVDRFYNTISFTRDPYVTAYNEGQRALVHEMNKMIRKPAPTPALMEGEGI